MMAVIWYKGDVSSAVSDAKTQHASFMVFVTSDDEYTILYEQVLKSLDFSKKKYIALKLVAYTEEYEQLKAIYRIVPVPCILVIDWETGLVMERISGAIFDEELEEALLDSIADLPKVQPTAESPIEAAIKDDTPKQVKIQFKMPSGESKTMVYLPEDNLAAVRKDACSLFKLNTSFTLAVPYPRRTLTTNEDSLSLLDLSLSPASTILVLSDQSASILPWNIFDSFWRMINVVLNYFRGLRQQLFQQPSANENADKKEN